MWIPQQLLQDDKVTTLKQGGLTDLEIEFLGWLSYYAGAINNSRNPVKAAHTLLAKDKTPKLLEAFFNKKKESVKPKERPEHEAVTERFRQMQKWVQQVEEDALVGDREGYFDS